MRPEETLWDVAKQYHTDMDAIRQNNQLEGDATDRMLLIPRVR
jgi:LysM repeat protein